MLNPLVTIALNNPSPTILTKSYKCPKRASKLIKRHLGNGTLKSVTKIEDRILVKFYCTGHRVDFHNWAYDYKEAAKVRKQPSITISTCTALVRVK
jgi:hypothetical protein